MARKQSSLEMEHDMKLAERAPRHATRTVLVTGATGMVGRALLRDLSESGTHVLALSRNTERARKRLGEGTVRWIETLDELPCDLTLDAVVHLAGARVLDRRWTAARRAILLRSRTDLADGVVNLMRRLIQVPRVLVSASAVSYYGSSGIAPRTEADSPVGSDYASQLCLDVEAAASRAIQFGVRVVPLRLGIVLGRDDGALPPLAMSVRSGFGAELGSGRQPVCWIHIDDAVRMIRLAIDADTLHGALNAVAPETPAQSDFVRAIATRLGRRVRIRVPAAALRLLLGERASLLLEGQIAVPQAARAAGFEFLHPTLAGALNDLLLCR